MACDRGRLGVKGGGARGRVREKLGEGRGREGDRERKRGYLVS